MTTTSNPRATASRLLPWLLLLLTTFGPISMDLYLPALPALTRELGAHTSIAQLTVTACLIGLAAGQLVSGPISDQFGRRRILLVGVLAYIATSILCAVSPSVEVLIAVRFVQGLAGGVGIVIAQAAGRDVFDGTQLIRFYGRLAVTGSMAAIVGPMLGGLLTSVVDWRGLFVFLAVLGALILVAVLVVFRETLPDDRRTSGGFAQTTRDYRTLFGDRMFIGAVLNQGFMFAAVFAYLAGSTFVLQDIYGLSPQWYAACFALNNVGGVIAGWLGGRLAERWSVVGTLVIGVVVAGAGAVGLVVAGLIHVPVGAVIVALLLLAFGVLVSGPPATTLALAKYPQMAGTAGSVLGTVRFGFGGVAAPLVGLAGSLSILPLGLVTTGAVLLAGASCLLLVGSKRAAEEEPAALGSVSK
ncbi:multidrug effflux MFS transporter [Micrococcales bacterium 31B]|nr:multidrug effflux MFS transporter [Micrococcales bacterium 31B]